MRKWELIEVGMRIESRAGLRLARRSLSEDGWPPIGYRESIKMVSTEAEIKRFQHSSWCEALT
jgi:hypothetical protein